MSETAEKQLPLVTSAEEKFNIVKGEMGVAAMHKRMFTKNSMRWHNCKMFMIT
jgi:hypothetical protein